jgi:serine/threonine-protein kinase
MGQYVPPEDTSQATQSPSLGRCGSYELLVELAAGGMATVYLARAADGRDAPLVAIKKPHRHLSNDKTFFSMLVDEARLASAIQHDNVVKVRELGFDAGVPFIVMDYVEGASLADIRKELSAVGRALDPRFALRMALDALAGLQAAHVLHDDKGNHLGIVHRDVSPHNVLIGCDGLARLTDFGIAKAEDRVQVTKTHEVKGKLAYLAPERIDKRRLCTVQSDVFSMAVVVWESCAGRRLFRGEEAIETLQEVLTAPIPPLRRIGVPIPEPLDQAILRGLSRELEARYKSAAEFADALMRAAGRENVATPAEIATLVEALFGERLRVRHHDIRGALGGGDVEHLLEVSGLNARPEPTEEMRERERRAIENIAPPAPSARYAFGGSENLLQRRFASPRVRAIALGAVAFLGAAVLAGVLARRKEDPALLFAPAPESTVRRVVLPLPFAAKHVGFDDQARDVAPAATVVVFDVPRASGVRHRVTAISVDGARAEGDVVESDGVARPAGGTGFVVEQLDSYDNDPNGSVIELPSPSGQAKKKRQRTKERHTTTTSAPPPSAPAPSASDPKPVGTVKDGFTRLK